MTKKEAFSKAQPKTSQQIDAENFNSNLKITFASFEHYAALERIIFAVYYVYTCTYIMYVYVYI